MPQPYDLPLNKLKVYKPIWRYYGHENIPGAVERKLALLMKYLQR